MQRKYSNSNSLETASFFYGTEVEKTSMYGRPTLFVVGLQPIQDVEKHIEHRIDYVSHIFFGANHSFNPTSEEEAVAWNKIIGYFVELGFYCSLDIPVTCLNMLEHMPVVENNRFVPQIRIPIPRATKMNYRTTIKIDDVGFNQTNPGVWVHDLHNLLTRDKFTDWSNYSNDEISK